MNIRKDLIVEGAAGRPFLLDAYLPDDLNHCAIVVFMHGFKGFKDWGFWDLVAERFVDAGFAFIKFNFSHNGTTIDQPLDFVDLEAFGQNNYSKELQDIDTVLNWIHQPENWPTSEAIDLSRIVLIGHSRGGGISIIKAAEDKRVHALITWAAVARLDYSWHEQGDYITHWKKEGVVRALNGRTKQMMPLYYQLYEDFQSHADAYSTESALQKRTDLPMLILHGTEDPAVPFFAGQQLQEWKPDAQLELLEGADHVFGGRHPWPAGEGLSLDGEILVNKSISFLISLG